MNGKKAKQCRKHAKLLAQVDNLPKVSYKALEYKRQMWVRDVNGGIRLADVVRKTCVLGECERNLMQYLKKQYKLNRGV